MTNDDHILITGSTGYFGKYIFKKLLTLNPQITALVRAENDDHARARLEDLVGKLSENINVYSSDLRQKNLGLSRTDYSRLADSITHILHSAASTRFNLPLDIARESNVLTTDNILSFAEKSKRLRRFGYVGTAFAAGKQKETIIEKALKNKGFINSYDWSKYEAEILVRAKMNSMPIAIYRPSLIISSDANQYHAALIILNLVKKNLLPVLPGLPEDFVDLISAKDASEIICELFINHFEEGKTYHITSSESAPGLGDIISITQKPDSKIIYTGHNESIYDHAVQKLISKYPESEKVYNKIDYFIKYLLYPKKFDNTNVKKALGVNLPKNEVLPILRKMFYK